jgi:4'-phosphopantetheinyl transferase
VAPPPLRFSLSHTHGLALVAVTLSCDIGADVENHTRALELEPIAKRFFSPRESSDVLACRESERTRRFYSYWTLKESYLKAQGLGLQRALDSFTFVPTASGFHLAREQSDCDDWQFALLDLTPEHLSAIAVRSREAVTLVRRGGLVGPASLPAM